MNGGGGKNRWTSKYCVKIGVPVAPPQVEAYEEVEPEYEDEPVIVKRKKKHKRLPGEKLLRKMHRDRMRESIKTRLAKLSIDDSDSSDSE